MKVRWEYEGKQYKISGHRNGQLYLNGTQCDCEYILNGIESGDADRMLDAKIKAKSLIKSFDTRNHCYYDYEKLKKEYEQSEMESRRFNNQSSSKTGENVLFVIISILALGLIGGVLYLVFQLWWIFVGDWAFNGPWANDVSGGEVVFETIIFFIALIVVIEEVVRRCINGHF